MAIIELMMSNDMQGRWTLRLWTLCTVNGMLIDLYNMYNMSDSTYVLHQLQYMVISFTQGN